MNEIYVKSQAELRDWLERNHKTETGVWLVVDKGKNRTITWSQIVDELLCFGWIDSTAGTVDDTKSKLRISPRNPKSMWSAINKEKVERLSKEKLMTEQGMKMVEIAKENGSWDILNDVDNLVIPKDLESEFKKYPNAAENFNNFPKSYKKIILHWLLSAKREETRAKRIQEVVDSCQRNIRIK